MRVLCTGGCGFLGRHVVDLLLARGDEVVNLDALTYAADFDRFKSREGYQSFVHDISQPVEPQPWSGKLGPFDALVHLAAETHVDNSISGPIRAALTNYLGTAQMLELARVWGIAKVVVMSTDEVTGSLGPHDPPTDSWSPISASSPYSAAKAGAELLARAYHRTFRLDVSIVRSTNLFGPYQHPEKFIPRAITYAIDGRPAKLFAEGKQIRDWLFVEDGAQGVVAALDRGEAGRIYCLGASCEKTNAQVLAEIASRMLVHGTALKIESVEDRPGHDFRYATDPYEANVKLGWRPEVSFDDGLDRTVAFYVSNHGWWRRAVERGGKWA